MQWCFMHSNSVFLYLQFHYIPNDVIQNCESILYKTKKINAQKNYYNNKLTGLTEYLLYINSVNNIQIMRHISTQ